MGGGTYEEDAKDKKNYDEEKAAQEVTKDAWKQEKEEEAK